MIIGNNVGVNDAPTASTEPYFLSLGGGRYLPTGHTGGAWSDDEQHVSPMAGLLVQEILDRHPSEHLQVGRICYDILGKIPRAEFQVEVRMLRPGRTIELLQAEASHEGRAFLRASVWRLLGSDTADVAGGAPSGLPAPETVSTGEPLVYWPGGYMKSVQVCPLGQPTPGRGAAWLRTGVRLRDRGSITDLARLTGLIDTANGIAPRQRPDRWLYPNTDLTIHLYRLPVGSWLGLDTEAIWGPAGAGLTSSTLFDEAGAWGSAAQVLTLRRRFDGTKDSV